jgi:hypothetical protein
MKNDPGKRLSEISSFEDFHIEKEVLDFRKKIIETNLKLTYLEVSERFSVSNLLASLSREVVFPKISDFLVDLIRKVNKNTHSDTDNSQNKTNQSKSF